MGTLHAYTSVQVVAIVLCGAGFQAHKECRALSQANTEHLDPETTDAIDSGHRPLTATEGLQTRQEQTTPENQYHCRHLSQVERRLPTPGAFFLDLRSAARTDPLGCGVLRILMNSGLRLKIWIQGFLGRSQARMVKQTTSERLSLWLSAQLICSSLWPGPTVHGAWSMSHRVHAVWR